MRKRTVAREFALQLLYVSDMRGRAEPVDFDDFVAWLRKTVEAARRSVMERYEGKSPPETIVQEGMTLELLMDAGYLQTLLRSEDVLAFSRILFDGARENLADIDSALTRAAQNWQLRRMAIVDRNILRMAVYEMLHLEEVPAKVSINEAIELGKRFSTAQSGSFINGILDRIRREKKL